MNSRDETEMLMALADGELAPAEAAALRRRIENDPALAARFASFVETRAVLQNPATAPGREGADPLAEFIRSRAAESVPPAPAENVVPLARRQRTAATRHAWRLPLAACILLGIGAVGGYYASQRGAGSGMVAALDLPPAAETALVDALTRLRAGASEGWSDSAGRAGKIAMIATHRLGNGVVCRQFELTFERPAPSAWVGASCRRTGAWRLEIAARRPAGEGGYAPATGANAVENYLDGLGGTGPLAAEDEAALMAQGWPARRR